MSARAGRGGAGAPIVAARGLVKRFGAVTALDGVDLTVGPGEIVALAGENGSGKSTLAGILAGVHAPDAGELRLDGTPRVLTRPRDGLEAGVALVSQELTGVPAMSVAENVLLARLPGPASRVRRRELVARAREWLDAVGVDVDPAASYRSLRAGDRELVEVAKALAARPRLLVLDEATARLPDPDRLFALVERLRAETGLAVLFVTHRLREIHRLADRAVVLRDGRLAGELDRAALSDAAITRLMVGRELSDLHAKPAVPRGGRVLRIDGLVTDRSPQPLHLDVHAGEIVGVAGLVGSGRSELLETVAGARRPRAGRVLVDDRAVPPADPRAAARRGIALVPEDRRAQALLLRHGVAANLALAEHRLAGRASRSRERVRARRAIDALRIRCAGPDAPVGSLSGGNQQKVVLARALAGEPRVLLLDEPTRGVDVGAKEDIYRFVTAAVTRGVAVLMASSDLLELVGLADRVLVLHDGRAAGTVPRAAVTEERLALLAAGGEEGRDD